MLKIGSLSSLLAALLLSTFWITPAVADPKVDVFDNTITLEEVQAAQRGWCTGLLAINDAYQKGGFKAAKAKAEAVIDSAYAYEFGPVAFKPTYAVGENTFREDRAGALAYFVGPDPSVKEFGKDQGFATYRNWKKCEIIDDVVQLFGDTANTMGFVKLTDNKGKVARPEKTWTFWKPKAGSIRIVLHHSSAPFDSQ
ncbi:MAG: hypothetical protein CBC48_04105 [bacterium TMED88]|nr:hypothetical protein [Deltaproteobacteria bacterium]OUV35396.1 MAG: hypothetical protein CBC48_04105 [bacterium TMED88]